MAKQIIVVGGGLGGLSAAIRLRSVGYDVRLFEKNEQLGGKMNELADGEYRFDTGPSLLTMPEIVDDLFAFTDRQRADYVSFLPLDPLCRYFWGDGQVLDAVSDVDKMAAEMAQIATRDAENYRRYLAYAAKIHELTAEVFLHTPVHETRQLLNRRNLIRALNIHKIDPLRTMHGGIRRFFKHPQIIQLFDRFATYTGSDPFRAPATLNIIPYIEMVLGGYYISGGMYALVRALTLLATDIGVEIYTDIAVDKILHNNGQSITSQKI